MTSPRRALIIVAAAALLTAAAALPVYANAPPPLTAFAFEFVDENGQPVTPMSLQLTRCVNWTCQPVYLDLVMGTCDVPGCAQDTQVEPVPSPFECKANFCYGHFYSWASWYSRHLVLVPRTDPVLNHALAGLAPKPDHDLGYGDAVGWRVVVTPDGLVITEDAGVTARAPKISSGYPVCPFTTPPVATIGFVITQVAELAAALLLLLLLGIKLRLIGGVLAAVGLINFATFPVVWFTFPALGPGPTTQAQAIAAFSLLAALLYAGMLVRLRPAFDPARRSMVVGLLFMALPAATVLVFGAATAASAAVNAAGIASSAATGAGLPYHITMPASEVFAYSAEALLLFLLCRPVLSVKQAVLLSVLANSASLALGLFLL